MTQEPQQASRSRYPGTRPFSDSPEDVLKFFGRGDEIDEIRLRVLSVPLLVQFGKSGLGKTSLLQAGLFPLLRQKPFLPVMVRLNIEEESLTAAVTRAIRESCAAEGQQFKADETPGLWELLSDITVWRGDLLLTPILVFDQFEEVFTLRDAAFRDELSAELGALATGVRPARVTSPDYEAAPDVKIVISLREDYLGSLEEFSAAIPGLFHERLRLEALKEKSARLAITQPADLPDAEGAPYGSPRFDFEPAALEAMVAYLEGTSGVIEPFQLQLLCRHAEKIATAKSPDRKKVTLTLRDFHEGRDFPVVLKHFYRDTLAKIDPSAQRRKAQRLCEEGLIGADGHRLMLERRQILGDYGLSQKTLDTLCEERLLRREKRQESDFYEISHDRLAASIRDSRPFRVSPKTRRVLWAIGLAVLLGLALVTFYGFRVRNERNIAQKERDSAEGLLTFLLGEEFLGEVRASGRTSMLELVQRHVKEEAGHRTDVNQGLAIRNSGDIKRNSGLLAASVTDFREALKLFDPQSNDPDVVREAARTQERLGSALTSQGRISEAKTQFDSAAAAWRRVIANPGKDMTREGMLTDCTSLASTLVRSAYLQDRLGDTQSALTTLQSAYAIASNLLFGPHGGECGSVAAGLEPYPEAAVLDLIAQVSAQRAGILNFTEDYQAAAILAQKARELAPTSASIRRDALTRRRDEIFTRSHDSLHKRVEEYRAVLKEFDELRRWDPKNRDWQFDRAVTLERIVIASLDCLASAKCSPKPSLEDTHALSLEVMATFRTLSKIDASDANIESFLLWAAENHANVLRARRDHGRALETLEEAEKIYTTSKAVHEPKDGEFAMDRNRRLRAHAAALANLNRLPEARTKIQAAFAELSPDSGVPQHIDSLRETHLLQEKILRQAGDPKGAARAATEAARLAARYEAISRAPVKESKKQADRAIAHLDQGVELFRTDRYADAMKEFRTARSLERDALRLDPTFYDDYDTLRLIHDWMQWTNTFLDRNSERTPDLRAATYAGQIAVWLAPPDKQKEYTAKLLDARNNFTSYLAGLGNTTQDALVMANEVVGVAELLVQDPQPEPRFVSALGVAKCSQGRLRKQLGVIGWEEALRSGLIYIDRAAAKGMQDADAAKDWGSCRSFLADQLATGHKEEAAEHYKRALKDYTTAMELAPWDEEAENTRKEVFGKVLALYEDRDDQALTQPE